MSNQETHKKNLSKISIIFHNLYEQNWFDSEDPSFHVTKVIGFTGRQRPYKRPHALRHLGLPQGPLATGCSGRPPTCGKEPFGAF